MNQSAQISISSQGSGSKVQGQGQIFFFQILLVFPQQFFLSMIISIEVMEDNPLEMPIGFQDPRSMFKVKVHVKVGKNTKFFFKTILSVVIEIFVKMAPVSSK